MLEIKQRKSIQEVVRSKQDFEDTLKIVQLNKEERGNTDNEGNMQWAMAWKAEYVYQQSINDESGIRGIVSDMLKETIYSINMGSQWECSYDLKNKLNQIIAEWTESWTLICFILFFIICMIKFRYNPLAEFLFLWDITRKSHVHLLHCPAHLRSQPDLCLEEIVQNHS